MSPQSIKAFLPIKNNSFLYINVFRIFFFIFSFEEAKNYGIAYRRTEHHDIVLASNRFFPTATPNI